MARAASQQGPDISGTIRTERHQVRSAVASDSGNVPTQVLAAGQQQRFLDRDLALLEAARTLPKHPLALESSLHPGPGIPDMHEVDFESEHRGQRDRLLDRPL